MTAISSTTSPAGSWSSTAVAAFPTKATIQLGWSSSRSGSSKRAARKRRASVRSPASAAGEIQGALSALRGPGAAGGGEDRAERADHYPGGGAAGAERDRVRGPQEGLRQQPPHR